MARFRADREFWREMEESYELARGQLLSRLGPEGYWVGRLADSPLATATAVAALAAYTAAKLGRSLLGDNRTPGDCSGRRERQTPIVFVESEDRQRLANGLGYLVATQRRDGGWGDTDRDPSNIATTALVMAAFRLTGCSDVYESVWESACQYFHSQGGVEGILARYGKDRTFAAPILAVCALADIVPWRAVPQLPFELAVLPQRWLGSLGLPVVSYAIPALVAIGQLRWHARGRRPFFWRPVRRWASGVTLQKLENMQPPSGGFLEAIPLTAFVVLSLCAIGRHGHPVVEKGVAFLRRTARANGSWPVDINLATWLTSLGVEALSHRSPQDLEKINIGWLLACQQGEVHPFTSSPPGGWGWTSEPGAVPDADDTSAALVALARFYTWAFAGPDATGAEARRLSSLGGQRGEISQEQVKEAALRGIRWLLGLQNRDGGIPTFCRGWGKLPFDRSAVDLTAHALRAILAWLEILCGGDVKDLLAEKWSTLVSKEKRRLVGGWFFGEPAGTSSPATRAGNPFAPSGGNFGGTAEPHPWEQMLIASAKALNFLFERQRADGAWEPLWFGNPFEAGELNLVYGTSRVLLALTELFPSDSPAIRKAAECLIAQQNYDGGWGMRWGMILKERAARVLSRRKVFVFPTGERDALSSMEETAWAVEALAAVAKDDYPSGIRLGSALWSGACSLSTLVRAEQWRDPAPVGLYFARLWYYEEIYPLIFAVGALGRLLNIRKIRPSDKLQA
jgi:squalene-hopene/tetraprenyl-beta-curcumene cyclase